MTVLAMCCFALVAWTIIVTGQHDPMQGKNVTYIFIDDTKSINALNITLKSVAAVNKAEAAQEKKVQAVNKVATSMAEERQTTLRTLRSPTNESKVLCQCMCDLEVIPEDILAVAQVHNHSRSLNHSLANHSRLVAKNHPQIVQICLYYEDWGVENCKA